MKRRATTNQDPRKIHKFVKRFNCSVESDDRLLTIGVLICGQMNKSVVASMLRIEAIINASMYNLSLRQELADQWASVRREIEEQDGRNSR